MIKENFDFFFFRSLQNTNDKIKKIDNSQKSISNLALYCEKQLEGRGRKGRIWLSNKGDLTCSFLLKKRIKVSEVGKINLFVVSELIEVFKKIGINQVKFKWPNDIYVDNKKIAGVLIETNVEKNTINRFIVGIGINVKNKFSEKNFISTSLNDLKKAVKPLRLFFMISKYLIFFVQEKSQINFNFHSKNLSNLFFSKDSVLKVNCGNKLVEGKFKEINSFGHLVLTNNKITKKITYGEIV